MAGWTRWQGITVPGDGGFNPGEGNANNLNAAVGGGVHFATVGSRPGGHGLCGDVGGRNGFSTHGLYGPVTSRGTYVAGGQMDVRVKVTAYHAGWFEFRLSVPPDGGASWSTPLTQESLNQRVLTIHPSTPHYPAVVDYKRMNGIGYGGGGAYKCAYTGGNPWPTLLHPTRGYADETSTTPNTLWPHGSCCNDGGACSDPANNTDRCVRGAHRSPRQPPALSPTGSPLPRRSRSCPHAAPCPTGT